MADINAIIAKSKGLASTSVPVGGSANSDAVFQIFQNNPGQHFSGKILTTIFKEAGVELKNASNILFKLAKANKIVRVKSGWYKLA